jgi:hypothetical protein
MRPRPRTEELWARLADRAGRPAPPAFDPTTLDTLPPPAARWLRYAIADGAALADTVVVAMTGSIRVGSRWLPFRGDQILRAGVGFVWKPVVGGRALRITGADLLGPDQASMDFRLHGLVPIARASGPDTARSAAGRLAAETIAWLPQAATPQAGATWRAVDDEVAVVRLDTPGGPLEVSVGVDADGRLATIDLDRWNDSVDPPRTMPFGGDITGEHRTGDGVVVAGSGTVGWGHGTPDQVYDGFYRFELETVTFPV